MILRPWHADDYDENACDENDDDLWLILEQCHTKMRGVVEQYWKHHRQYGRLAVCNLIKKQN